MGIEALSSDDQKKFDSFLQAAKNNFQEIEDIRGSLKDMAKALEEELGIKSKVIMMTARTAYKNDLEGKKEAMAQMEYLLEATGNG